MNFFKMHLAPWTVLGVLLLLSVHGCSSPNTLVADTDHTCSLDSDCTSGLICAFARCSAACRTSADCGPGGACVFDSMMQPVCLYPDVAACTTQSNCTPPLACASDFHCRNLCTQDADCNVLGITGRVCAADSTGVHYCAVPAEVSDAGVIIAPPGSVAQGSPDATVSPDSGAEAGPEMTGGQTDATMSGPDTSACTPGATCSPSPCQSGQYVCEDSGLVCQPIKALTDGTQCIGVADAGAQADGGTGGVCFGGVCTACNAGQDCSVAGSCAKKTIECSTGQPECTAAGNVSDGTPCASGMYCYSGVCSACTVGASCTPVNPCHKGSVGSCAGGVATCTDTTVNATNGTTCGTNMVCNAGTCMACTAGALCTPTNVCDVGQTSCQTGASVCTDTGANPAKTGSACGTNAVCNGGTCVSCTADATCVPTNICDTGKTSCATGASTCADMGSNVAANGTKCATNAVCLNGTCGACTAGVMCTPTNVCDSGQTSCMSGTSTCVDTGANAAVNGTVCGSNRVCNGGACVACIPPTVSGSSSVCAGSSDTLTASAGDSYSWSTGATTRSISVTTTGSYVVTVTAGGCSLSSAPFAVTGNSLPSSAFTWTPTHPNALNAADFSATATGENYSWVFTGATPATSSSATPTPSWSAGGTYAVQLTVTNPTTACYSTTSQNVAVCTLLQPQGASVLPTPVTDGSVRGIEFVALATTTLTQITFWKQDLADNVYLTGTDGSMTPTVPVSTTGGANVVSVNWPITSGVTYYLLNTTPSNTLEIQDPAPYPQASGTISVSLSFLIDSMGNMTTDTGYWDAFTNLLTCP